MSNNLFFTCGFQSDEKWLILSNRKSITPIDTSLMLSMIDKLKNNIGGARLEVIPEPDIGISELSVQYDGVRYLFTLVEYATDGELMIRGKSGFNDEWRLIEFLSDGELYPPNAFTTDFDFVKKVFIEFLEKGDVSYELMDRIY
ncbi:DUF6911 family protein [Ursidibacter sp. B-7004-1]